ncbi:MAG: MetQ/NlpA family ABC transporter substrate-binding protein [Oscillospiraceae bacterium]
MKKLLVIVLALALCLSLFAACGTKPEAETPNEPVTDKTILKVGASPTPHAEILEQIKEALAADGIELQIIEYTDYVQPNNALEAGEIDANYFQHKPYLDSFNTEYGTHLVSAAAIHYEPLGIYAGKSASIDALPEGGKIAVPNDATNEARALLLLEANGIIKLKKDAGINATKLDIAENPKNVEILEIEAAQIARAIQDVDLAAINGNYAIQAGLTTADALVIEDKDSVAADTYANILAVKSGNENNEAIQKLCAALKSETVRSYITKTYGNDVIPKF